MASRGSQGTPPTNRESFLSRKKKEIVDKSMALLQQSLDRCLDNSVSAPPPGAVARRRAKRARDDDYAEDCGSVGHGHGGEANGKGGIGDGAAPRQARTKKTRLSPQEPPSGGKKFACPFCKHNPAKYREIKTCCGPGWDDVHRVKEHVYRRHTLKNSNFCPRCFEHFDKLESLKSHQRADNPCALRDRSPDVITDEQEKQLRTRAKSHSEERVKWEDMYRTIFPGEKVPATPYNDGSSPADKSSSRTGGGGGGDNSPAAGDTATSRWDSVDECREFLRTEIPRIVRPAMENYASLLLEEVQDKVNQKAVEVIREVEARMLRTFRFQEEQAASSSAGAAAAAALLLPVGGMGGAGEPSPPPSPGVSGGGNVGPGLEVSSGLSEMLEQLRQDPIGSEFCANLEFVNLEGLLAGPQGFGYDAFSVDDSAYYTGSSSGGQEAPYGLHETGYVYRC